MTGSTTRVSFMAALHCAPVYVCVCVKSIKKVLTVTPLHLERS